MRNFLLYECPVWLPGLTKKLTKDIECVQKRCLKLLFPALSYTESLSKSGLERLDDRRDIITQSLFRPKTSLTLSVKVSHSTYIHLVRWFCGLHIHIKFHW